MTTPEPVAQAGLNVAVLMVTTVVVTGEVAMTVVVRDPAPTVNVPTREIIVPRNTALLPMFVLPATNHKIQQVDEEVVVTADDAATVNEPVIQNT